MEEQYKVSIGIPMYNCQNYIERCLNSIFEQTYKNIEIIIVNDGSTDNSLNIVNKIKQNNCNSEKMKIYTKENTGVSSTRNYAIEKATGEFILLIDSDDWLEKNAIETMVRIQRKYNCDVVKVNYFVNLNKDKIISKGNHQKYEDELVDIQKYKENIIGDIILGNIPSYTWSMLIKKKVITPNLFFENSINHLEDKIFLIKLMSNIKTIFFSSEIVYHYFLNTNGLMHKNNFEYYLERDIEIHKKTGEIIKEYYENDKDLFIVNNTMSSYAIERNLFNIYKTTNEQELIKEYNKVRDYWKKISRETDYKYLKQSKYAVKGDYFIKKWLKEDITSIIKTYNKEIRIENVKRIIKKIIGR